MVSSTSFLHLFLFFILMSLASSTTLSYDILESRVLLGRSLLQQKAACPVDLENQNYTIITSQCKGPNYDAKACCGALKELACPFADELNDLKNDCATTLFSYINIYGKYPPGLFSSLCHENKDGIDCDAVNAQKQQASGTTANLSRSQMLLMILTASSLVLFNLF